MIVAVTVAAVAVPGVRTIVEGGDAPDGFPLSTYPMFTRQRGRVVEVPSVVVDDHGTIERLSPLVIAGTDQVIEAHNVVARAISSGQDASLDLCRHVAAGLDDRPAGATVDVVVERYDALAWAAGDGEPLERDVVARCR